MSEKKQVEALINGGEANAGPPLGPALGPLGVNVLMIVNKINELTKPYAGMKVPVKVIVDVETKSFEVEVGTPTTSALIVKELGIEKGSATAKTLKAGDMTLEQAVTIAQRKLLGSYSRTLKSCVKEVVGTCVSMGITIEGKEPAEIIAEIDKGTHDQLFKDEKGG